MWERFLALARSPSWTALKIRCRSRRTLSSWAGQSRASQSRIASSGSVRVPGRFHLTSRRGDFHLGHRGGDPGAVPHGGGKAVTRHRVLTCPSVLAHQALVVKGLTCPTSACFRSQARWPGIRPVIRDWPPGAAVMSSRFPAAFRPPAFRFLGILVPPRYSVPLTVGLPALAHRTLTGSPMFRTREMRLGKGRPLYPGMVVPTRPRMLHDRRLPHHSGASLISPVLHPGPGSHADEASSRISGQSPVPSLPLACDPQPERGPSGFPASFTPGRYRPRMSLVGTGHGH